MVTPPLPGKVHANRSSRFLVILLTKKQTNKETKSENNTPPPVPTGGGVIIGQKLKVTKMHPVNRVCGRIPPESAPVLNCYFLFCAVLHDEFFIPKTRVLGLSISEDFVILACVVFTQCQRVTDRRTDGHLYRS